MDYRLWYGHPQLHVFPILKFAFLMCGYEPPITYYWTGP